MTWPSVLQEVWNGIGLMLTAGGGGALVAFGLFKWMGTQWLEQRFKERLQHLKHEQDKDIEGLRYKISSLFSRISKIHDKEFEVLPRAWFLLHDAQGKSHYLVASFKWRPDFKSMPGATFEDFLRGCRLSDSEKEELRHAPDKSKYYGDAMFWIDLNDAQLAQTIFHNYIIEHRIFMTDELREKFGVVDDALGKALLEHQIWKQSSDGKLLISSLETISKLADKIAQVEKAVQERLKHGEA